MPKIKNKITGVTFNASQSDIDSGVYDTKYWDIGQKQEPRTINIQTSSPAVKKSDSFLNEILNDSRVQRDRGVNGTTMAKWLQGNAGLMDKLKSKGYTKDDIINEAYSQTRFDRSAFAKDMTAVSRANNQPFKEAPQNKQGLNTSPLGESGVNALFKQYYGRDATRDELNYWKNKSDADLRPKLIPNSATELERRRQAGQQGGETSPVGDDVVIEETPTFIEDELTDDSLYQPFIDNNPFLAEQLNDPNVKAQFDALPQDLKMAYIQTVTALGNAVESGKVINPNVEITPEKAAQFLNQAKTELDPYYQEQIGFIQDDLNESTARLQEDFSKGIRRAEEPFKQSLKEQAEAEAQAGLAFGSERLRREKEAVSSQQQKIDDFTTDILRGSQETLKQGERKLGSEAFQDVVQPSLRQFKVSTQGFTPQGTRRLFTPQGGLMGEINKNREVATRTRASELEEAERKRLINLT